MAASSDQENVPLSLGQLRSYTLLGSTALYRIVGLAADTVCVEAVRVPGIAPGTRVRLTREALGAMRTIVEPDSVDQDLAGTVMRWGKRVA